MDIFLVRHGEAAAAWGQSGDPGLSELGRQQASAAAQQLLTLVDTDTQLFSSPLARAQETAEPLASALGVAVSIDDAFRELPAPVPLEQRSFFRLGRLHVWTMRSGGFNLTRLIIAPTQPLGIIHLNEC